MVGRAIAFNMRGCTSDGPGPIRVRTGGMNDLLCIVVFSLFVLRFCNAIVYCECALQTNSWEKTG